MLGLEDILNDIDQLETKVFILETEGLRYISLESIIETETFNINVDIEVLVYDSMHGGKECSLKVNILDIVDEEDKEYSEFLMLCELESIEESLEQKIEIELV